MSAELVTTELHHVLKDMMEPHDTDAEIADLERRRTDLAARAGGEMRWVDVAVEAALGLADVDTLLQRSLSGGHVARVRSIAGAFAALAGDAMMMLACPVPADDWHRLAEAVGDRQVPPPELQLQDGAESQPPVQTEGESSRLVLHGWFAASAARHAGIRNGRAASAVSMVHERQRRSQERLFSRGPPRSGPRNVCSLERSLPDPGRAGHSTLWRTPAKRAASTSFLGGPPPPRPAPRRTNGPGW